MAKKISAGDRDGSREKAGHNDLSRLLLGPGFNGLVGSAFEGSMGGAKWSKTVLVSPSSGLPNDSDGHATIFDPASCSGNGVNLLQKHFPRQVEGQQTGEEEAVEKITNLISINFHLFKPCDARCDFCFATFRDVKGHLSLPDAKRLIDTLREAGGQKITFAGGEPTLYPFIGELVSYAKDVGFVTGIVTNGSKLPQLLFKNGESLDWAALSVDSGIEETQAALGRGRGDHVHKSIQLADLCRENNVRVKLNSVVTSLNCDEDMSDLVRRISPERWKVFQVLPVVGQNDGKVEPLLISREKFDSFIRRHAHLEDEGFSVIPEDNDAMTDSYVMIDPLGRFYGNTAGVHRTSPPILDVGVIQALSAVGYDADKFVARGGIYSWK